MFTLPCGFKQVVALTLSTIIVKRLADSHRPMGLTVGITLRLGFFPWHVSVAQVAQSPSPVLILSDSLCLLLAMAELSSTFQQDDAQMVICRLSGQVVASLNREDSCSCHIVQCLKSL